MAVKLYNHNLYLYRILLFIFELLVVFLSLYLSQSSVDNLVLFSWSSLPKKFCLKFSRVSFRISVYNFFYWTTTSAGSVSSITLNLPHIHDIRVSRIMSRRNAMPRSSPMELGNCLHCPWTSDTLYVQA